MMDAFEKSLRGAMRRESPPEGFAERVLSRAAHDRTRVRGWKRMPLLAWASAALAAIVLLIGLTEYRQAQQIRGERARQELLLALHIAGSKLRMVQNRVIEINHKGDD